jgi:beta-1,4-N-acetylglucosaminyltransferase
MLPESPAAAQATLSATKVPELHRECFVTVGATASFQAILDAVCTREYLKTLGDLEFTHLTVQCGPDLEYFHKIKPSTEELKAMGLGVYAFDFNKKGLGQEMRG